MASSQTGTVPVRYHKPFRFMLLEKQQRENKYGNGNEPDFGPRYRKTLPPGLDIKQGTSLGVGNLTQLPVYPSKNEIQTQETYRDTVPEQLHLRRSRFKPKSEEWQSVNSTWNRSGVRPTTGTFLQDYKRQSTSMPRQIKGDNNLLRYHSASYERAIPGYAGHKSTQPKYPIRSTRTDNQYGPKYNDTTPLYSNNNFRRTGTFSRMVTLVPPHNPFANTSK